MVNCLTSTAQRRPRIGPDHIIGQSFEMASTNIHPHGLEYVAHLEGELLCVGYNKEIQQRR